MQRRILLRLCITHLCIFIIGEPYGVWQVLGLNHTFLIMGFMQYLFLGLLLTNHRYVCLCISQQVTMSAKVTIVNPLTINKEAGKG